MPDDQNDRAVFPQPEYPGATCAPAGGLQLRDLFAAHALPAAVLLASQQNGLLGLTEEEVGVRASRLAYTCADAMLEEREK